MADYTFIEMKEWFYNNAPKIINEKYFLYVMGSIFLLGIFTKWLAAFGYGRMIRKAEHMSNPKNATLRQIKRNKWARGESNDFCCKKSE